MDQTHLQYAALLLVSGSIALSLIPYTWPRRKAPGAITLIVMMAFCVVWAWTYALFWLFPTLPAPGFWLNATYFGVAVVPTVFMLFAFRVTRSDTWIKPSRLVLLFIEPGLTLLLLWTDPWHGLFFGGEHSLASTDIYAGGAWFWINVVYSYLVILIGFSVMGKAYLHARGVTRKQYGLVLFGTGAVLIVNLGLLLGFSPLPGLDLTPLLFTVQGICYTLAIRYLSLFDLFPIVQDILLGTMSEGLIVLDGDNRVVEINQSALDLLGLKKPTTLGLPIRDAVLGWPELEESGFPVQDCLNEPWAKSVHHRSKQVLAVNTVPLRGKTDLTTGTLITWRDITPLIQVQTELKNANQKLQEQLEEIRMLQADLKEQALRDALTGCYNRRYLNEALPRELARADRNGKSVGLLMVDIDLFKNVNDTYGHIYGDKVIISLAEKLLSCTRREDIVVRMGGDEFLMVLIDTDLGNCAVRAEQIRYEVECMQISEEDKVSQVTISIGVAGYPESGREIQEIITRADHALYLAKATGKNKVCA